MKMSGEQRIAASREQVWNALFDPEVLKRCIPGCQSLSKESDTRMVAIAEIKIGPIGARFNGAVDISDMVMPDSYTMTIEGQGGTVGFVKSIAKVRYADDGSGGTLLAYEMDAQIGGRLAQLGGPIMDATAKQLAARFFAQLAAVIAGPAEAPPEAAVAGGAMARAPRALPAGAASRGSPVTTVLAMALTGVIGYLVGRSVGADATSDWMGIAIGLLLFVVGFAGFEYGRRVAAPVVTLDPALLARLLEDKR